MASGEDKQTLALLKNCDVLSDISTEALQVLLPGITMSSYRPRQVIYLPGDRAQGVHFLSQGRIKISKVTRDGKELTLAYRTEGDFFGEPCLLEGGPREEMAEAMDASVTVEVGRELLDGLLKTDGRAAYKFARALILRRKDLETRVEQLIFKDVGAKLAELLLNLGQEHAVSVEDGWRIGAASSLDHDVVIAQGGAISSGLQNHWVIVAAWVSEGCGRDGGAILLRGPVIKSVCQGDAVGKIGIKSVDREENFTSDRVQIAALCQVSVGISARKRSCDRAGLGRDRELNAPQHVGLAGRQTQLADKWCRPRGLARNRNRRIVGLGGAGETGAEAEENKDEKK